MGFKNQHFVQHLATKGHKTAQEACQKGITKRRVSGWLCLIVLVYFILFSLFCFSPPLSLHCPLKQKLTLLAFLRSRTMFRCTDGYANSSFLLLSFCPPPCQVVGADAVTTARSREALVDAVKRSGGINTSEGRTEEWGVDSGGDRESQPAYLGLQEDRRITVGQREEQREEREL